MRRNGTEIPAWRARRRGRLRLSAGLVCAFGIVALVVAGACRIGDLEIFQLSPHERYADSLRSAGLAETELGRAWIRAGTAALAEAHRVELPYREIGYVDPARPEAVAFEITLPAGQRLEALVTTEPAAAGAWFLDLLRDDGGNWETVESASDSLELSRRVDDREVLVVRLQPELLRGGRYELLLQGRGSLAFPVEGADGRDIGSRFGDPRAGGRRSHRGVDIFAPRGTAVLAATDGRITRVGTNRLGGNVVHMRGEDGLSFYYAHLHRQSVRTGVQVRAGEPLGEVGNTGNARGTPPHLHFGVFRRGEAVDPYGYLVDLGAGSPPVEASLERLGEWTRTATAGLRLRGGPGTDFSILEELPDRHALHVEAAVRAWYRVRTVERRSGFVAARLTSGTDEPLDRRTLDRTVELLSEPSAGAAPVASLPAGSTISVGAAGGGMLLVTSTQGARGWIPSG